MIILWILPCCVHPPIALFCICIMSSRSRCMLVLSFFTRSRKVHITFLIAHMGYYAPGTMPPNAQVRRDDFLGSRVCKCIHIRHRISISSWHRNGHIVPAFVTYHIHALHLISHFITMHPHLTCFLHTIYFHVYSCMILAFSSAKQKQKRKHENSHCILSCMC